MKADGTAILPEHLKVSFTLRELLDTRRSYEVMRPRVEKLKAVRFHCVYVVKDGAVVLYVGSTNNGPRSRMLQHQRGDIRFDQHLRDCADVALTWTVDAYPMPSLDVARLLEKYAIRALNPLYNDKETANGVVALDVA